MSDDVTKALNEGENRYRQSVLGQAPLLGYPTIVRAPTATSGLDVEASRRICDAATKGPWQMREQGNQYVNTRKVSKGDLVAAAVVAGIQRPWNPHAMVAFNKLDEAEEARFIQADAEFIVHVRTAHPQALDEIVALRSRMAEQEKVIEADAERFRDFATNYDHDEDSHRHRGTCWVCDAEQRLAALTEYRTHGGGK